MSINATLIAEIIVFAIFVWFTMRFVWPPLSAAMADRQKKIADGLASAERGEHELQLAQKRASEIVKEAREQAGEVVEQANRRSTELVDESRVEAREAAAREHAAAQARVEQEVAHARAELKKRVSELAILGASRILEREVDAKAHSAMLDELAEQL